MAYRLYIDTSVFGALFDAEDERRVEVTKGLLRRLTHAPFAAYVGTPLLEEVARAPKDRCPRLERAIAALQPTLLDEDELSLDLAQAYVDARVLQPKQRGDARHLALASVAGLDAVVSWNLIDIISPFEVPDA